MNRTPPLPPAHPDRQISVEEYLEESFVWVLAEAEVAGIGEAEAAVAIERLAQAHLDQLACLAETERQIDQARRASAMPSVYDHPPRIPYFPPKRPGWHFFAAGVATAVLPALLWLLWP